MIRSISELKDRGVKQTDKLYVLNATNAIAVLVELAFIDESNDLALLEEKLNVFARAVARGATDFELMQK